MAEYIDREGLRRAIASKQNEVAHETPKTRTEKRAHDRAFSAWLWIGNYVTLMPAADVVGAYDEVTGPVDRRMLLELLEKDYQRIQKYWRDVSYTRDKYLEGYRAAMEAVENFTKEAACDERDV